MKLLCEAFAGELGDAHVVRGKAADFDDAPGRRVSGVATIQDVKAIVTSEAVSTRLIREAGAVPRRAVAGWPGERPHQRCKLM